MTDLSNVIHGYFGPSGERAVPASPGSLGDGEPVAGGVDFGTLADDGRLRAVTGFLEPASG